MKAGWLAVAAGIAIFALPASSQESTAAPGQLATPKSKPAALTLPDFGVTVADALVGRLAEGISARSTRITLSVFNKSNSESFTQVREQINDWFAQYRSIRLHYKITKWTADGTIQAHFQFEQYPQTQNFPAMRKELDVVFHAQRSKDGWRITAYEPSEFFLP